MKRVFDPIHRFIELDAGEVALVQTAPMQRLRRLHQLGLASYVFPGGEHTRFVHALGALAVGERVLAKLRRDGDYFSDEADYAAQRRLARASLLLHDVGHGPFSHASEAVLGRRHETRTRAILATERMREALARLDVDANEVTALVANEGVSRYPVLKELVSGPNLDADRMDYLLRDAYFTGVSGGSYDVEQLVGSLRVLEHDGAPVLGIDGRGIVALESFVLARYLMFASVYFHHTTRVFEHTLHGALRALWTDPQALDPVEEFLTWDDVRVLDAMRDRSEPEARALRDRIALFGLAGEWNAEGDLSAFVECRTTLEARFGAAVWADAQEQLLHRLPLGIDAAPTVFVGTLGGIIDAREASHLIAKLSGKAFWRKLYVRKRDANVAEARALCRGIIARRSRKHPRLFD